jgi:hypothetical protein
MQLKPMPMKTFFELNVGDRVFIKWNKDDNPRDVRLNRICTVEDKFEDVVFTDDDYEWYKSEVNDFESNKLDTSRGFAYFFFIN